MQGARSLARPNLKPDWELVAFRADQIGAFAPDRICATKSETNADLERPSGPDHWANPMRELDRLSTRQRGGDVEIFAGRWQNLES